MVWATSWSWARKNALSRVGGDLKIKDDLIVLGKDKRIGKGGGTPQDQGLPKCLGRRQTHWQGWGATSRSRMTWRSWTSMSARSQGRGNLKMEDKRKDNGECDLDIKDKRMDEGDLEVEGKEEHKDEGNLLLSKSFLVGLVYFMLFIFVQTINRLIIMRNIEQ